MRKDGILDEVVEVFENFGFSKIYTNSQTMIKKIDEEKAIVLSVNPANYDECCIEIRHGYLEIYMHLFDGYIHSKEYAIKILTLLKKNATL